MIEFHMQRIHLNKNRLNAIHLLILQGLFLCLLSSCQKAKMSSNPANQTIWMRVLNEEQPLSTDDQTILGQNPKIITDQQDNIYGYYFVASRKEGVFIQYDPEGRLKLKKVFKGFSPMDMVQLKSGEIVLCGIDPDHVYKWYTFYKISQGGQVDSALIIPIHNNSSPTWYSVNASMSLCADNSIIVSCVSHLSTSSSSPFKYIGSFVKLTSDLNVEWKQELTHYTSNEVVSQNSIIETNTNQYLFEFALSIDKLFYDSAYHCLLTGLLNQDGTMDTIYRNLSGFTVGSNGHKKGVINRYCNGLLDEKAVSFIYHFSSPELLGGEMPSIPSGFLRIGADARISDTIPISLPANYRILSCTQNQDHFLLTAYKTGVLSGTNDYSADQTLFLYGKNWHVSKTFSFQQFYADHFSSAAPCRDGGYILLGRIQSFNGPSNKLILLKFKPR